MTAEFAREVAIPYWRSELRKKRRALAKLRAEQARTPQSPQLNLVQEAWRAVFSPTYIAQPRVNNPTAYE